MFRELWGPGEIARSLEVDQGTVRRWRQRADFPRPVELEIGPVWDAERVRSWRRRDLKRRREARAF